jgi:O-antigen ligase
MGVVVPQSRSSILAISAVITLFFIMSYRFYNHGYKRLFYLFLGWPLLLLLIYMMGLLLATNYQAILAMGSSVSKRSEQISLSIKLIEENFILGVGLGGYNESTDTMLHLHNMYLKVFSELGFVGFGLFSIIIILSFSILLKCYSSSDIRIASFSFSLILALFGTLVALFFASGITVFSLWLILAMVMPIYKLNVKISK